MTKILAWHGDQQLRDRIVARMHEHRAADDFYRLIYQRIDPDSPLGYRGCAIGCLLDPQPAGEGTDVIPPTLGWCSEVEQQFGIPRRIAQAIDYIFEAFDSRSDAADFAVAVTESIPVGADLSAVAGWAAFLGSEKDAPRLVARLRSAPVPAASGGESGE